MEYSFVFVVQAGSLEIKSMLLAASLQRQLRCSHELIAAIPQPRERWGQPAATTLTFLRRLGVRLEPISNGFTSDYPIGNKISCLGVTTDAQIRIFLDSDMLALQPFTGLCETGAWGTDMLFGAVPADTDTFGANDAIWALIYGGQNLSLPRRRMRATVSGQRMLPYFNAGFIAVDRRVDFAATWLRVCREIEADQRISNKWPWLDQIGLPVAVRYLGMDYVALDERYNYPAHLKGCGGDVYPYFVHYHHQKVLARSPGLREFVSELAREFPEVRDIIGANRKWWPVLQLGVGSALARYFRRGRR
jgi:hypothetical protein